MHPGDWTPVTGLISHTPLLSESSGWPFSVSSPGLAGSSEFKGHQETILQCCWCHQFTVKKRQGRKIKQTDGIKSKTQLGCWVLPAPSSHPHPYKDTREESLEGPNTPAPWCVWCPLLDNQKCSCNSSKHHPHTFGKPVDYLLLFSAWNGPLEMYSCPSV